MSLLTNMHQQIQALRDLYLVHKQISEVECRTKRIYDSERGTWATQSQLYSAQIGSYFRRFTQLFSKKHKRLQNALLASCTVNLSQQLCGSKESLFSFYVQYFSALFDFPGALRVRDDLKPSLRASLCFANIRQK